MESKIRLTEYSHGAGCGCKIAPSVLNKILDGVKANTSFPDLLVGNDTRDDAAVIAIDGDKAIISTTDFFMPIVDDPFEFGGIASVNAISDIYAMGGKPLMAISILGWPIDKLAPEVAQEVVKGAVDACSRAGIPLAGGHSIDAPEPIFGLAVTGIIDKDKIKTNNNARADCELYLTKPIGIGILTTAQKRGILEEADRQKAVASMLALNKIGMELAELNAVKALTDVTGFGLLGHLRELCEGSNLQAVVEFDKLPLIDGIDKYLKEKAVPGGTIRNFKSYGHLVSNISEHQKHVLCDPQTSGGLLVALAPRGKIEFKKLLKKHGLELQPFGKLKVRAEGAPLIQVL